MDRDPDFDLEIDLDFDLDFDLSVGPYFMHDMLPIASVRGKKSIINCNLQQLSLTLTLSLTLNLTLALALTLALTLTWTSSVVDDRNSK
jgi:hypothetical protein